jgi:hypothetical protein
LGSFRKKRRWFLPLRLCRLPKAHAGSATVLVDECTPMVAVNSATSGALASESATNSTLACLQTDSDFAGFIISELNAGLLKDVLYLEDRGEVSFHDSFILLDPLEGRQTHAGGAGKLTLAPA